MVKRCSKHLSENTSPNTSHSQMKNKLNFSPSSLNGRDEEDSSRASIVVQARNLFYNYTWFYGCSPRGVGLLLKVLRKTTKKRVSDKRAEIRDIINRKLQECTGDTGAKMQWAHYFATLYSGTGCCGRMARSNSGLQILVKYRVHSGPPDALQ
ncbi:hypothetical protein BDR07DRAFT_1384200 [Suillus spraguei]|nr:hypothetical protein BDR07DRAFT_1384200 [Suillus spraguei]